MLGSSYKIGLLYYLTLYSVGLRQLGHDVIVISSQGEQTPGLLRGLKEKSIKYCESVYIDKRNIFSIYKAAREIVSVVKSENIDVIHVNGFSHLIKSYFALRFINISKKIPVVFMVHTIRHGSKYEKWVCLIGSWLMNKCIDLAMPVSEWERSRLIKSGLRPDKAFTIHNAVDFEKFDWQMSEQSDARIPGINPEIFSHETVASLAQLIPRKGINYLLQAVPKVLKVFPNTKFLILGDGPLKSKLENKSKRMGIANNVYFAGMLENKYIPKILSKIDVALVTSFSETFGFAIVEPMAAGKPVITTPVGIAPEIIKDGENGFIVPPKDSNALAEAILFLLRNKEKAKEMGIKARGAVEKRFGLDIIARKLEEAYNLALQGK